jgi:hypothetical protein
MTSATGVEESPSANVSFDVVPNPFSRQTTFEYFIRKAEEVQFVNYRSERQRSIKAEGSCDSGP